MQTTNSQFSEGASSTPMDPFSVYGIVLIIQFVSLTIAVLVCVVVEASIFTKVLLFLGFLFFPIVCFAPVLIWLEYNFLAALRNRRDASWNLIEFEIKRRDELCPHLEAVCEKFQIHEKETFTEVALARRQLDSVPSFPQKLSAYEGLATQWNGLINRLMVVVEAHPQLTTERTVQQLMGSIESSADRINQAERTYNKTTETLNAAIDRVPTKLVASQFGFTKSSILTPSADSRYKRVSG